MVGISGKAKGASSTALALALPITVLCSPIEFSPSGAVVLFELRVKTARDMLNTRLFNEVYLNCLLPVSLFTLKQYFSLVLLFTTINHRRHNAFVIGKVCSYNTYNMRKYVEVNKVLNKTVNVSNKLVIGF